eukprot:COSAG02_NODE_122_length_35306_cov_98.280967_2_plen_1144_part_00
MEEDRQREQRDAESPQSSQMGKIGVATALAAGAGLVFAGLNEIAKRTGDAATVEAPKNWGDFHHKLAPLIEHIVFDKYSADGETVRATDMRRVVERLFGPRSAQDMLRHRVGQDTGVVPKQQFMDWMLRASHVPTDEASMDKLHLALSEVPDWTICVYEVVGQTRARTTLDTAQGEELGMLSPGMLVNVLQIVDISDEPGVTRQRLRFKWAQNSPLESLSGAEAWVSATAKNGDHLLVRTREVPSPAVENAAAAQSAAPPVRDTWTLEQESDTGKTLKLTTSQAKQLGTLYQNQRKRVGIFASSEFTAANLLKVERPEWSDDQGKPMAKGELPPGMVWEIERIAGKTDDEGYEYATNWNMKWTASPDRTGLSQSWVRRRKWVAVEAQALAGGTRIDDFHLAAVPATEGGHLVVEVWQARGLPAGLQGEPPDVAVRVSCETDICPLDGRSTVQSHTTATRTATREPCWGIEGAADDAQRCRHHFILSAAVWARIASLRPTASNDSCARTDSADDFVLLSDGTSSPEPMLELEVYNTKERTLVERVEDRNAPQQDTTFGRVHIPLRTVLCHHSCDGWHLLVGGEGELRVGWLLIDRSSRVPFPLPSPNEVLQVKAWQKANDFMTKLTSSSPEPEAEPQSEPAMQDTAGAAEEDGSDASQLELTTSQKAQRHTPHIRSGHYNGGDEMVTEKWDSIMPWLQWRGNAVDGEDEVPHFADPQGFAVPLRRAHEWQVAFSHQRCLVERGREIWQPLVSEARESNKLLSVVLQEKRAEVTSLVRRYGIPTELRQKVWPALLQADRKREGARLCNRRFYADLVEEYEARHTEAKEQIKTDLHRTLTGQSSVINNEKGIETLERVLGAFSVYNKRIGYCQAMNCVAAHLLCNLGEEDAFWLLVSVVQDLVPEYYGPKMEGLQAHTTVLERLAQRFLPETLAKFNNAGVPMGLIAAHWLLPLFSMTLPPTTLYRLWDVLLLHGSKVLVCSALTMMRGTPADALSDFQDVMSVLQHGAEAYYDATPFIEHTCHFAERLDDGEIDSWFEEEMCSKEWRLALLQSCPPLRRLLDEDNTGLNFPPYIVDRIGAIWFNHWQRHTGLKVVPEDDHSFSCELPFDIASVALNEVLPGLRKHPFLLDRLLVRAIAFSIQHLK